MKTQVLQRGKDVLSCSEPRIAHSGQPVGDGVVGGDSIGSTDDKLSWLPFSHC